MVALARNALICVLCISVLRSSLPCKTCAKSVLALWVFMSFGSIKKLISKQGSSSVWKKSFASEPPWTAVSKDALSDYCYRLHCDCVTWHCVGEKKVFALNACSVCVQHYVPFTVSFKMSPDPIISHLHYRHVWLASERSKDCIGSQVWPFERIIELKKRDANSLWVLFGIGDAAELQNNWAHHFFPVLFFYFAAASQQGGCMFISGFHAWEGNWKL